MKVDTAKATTWLKANWKQVALGVALLLFSAGMTWLQRETKKELLAEQRSSQEASSLASENEMKFLSEQEKVQILENKTVELKQKLKEAGSSSSSVEPLLVDGKPVFGPDGKPVVTRRRQNDFQRETDTDMKVMYEMLLQSEKDSHEETRRLLTIAQQSRSEAWAQVKQLEESRPRFKPWDVGAEYEFFSQAWGGSAGWYAPLGLLDVGAVLGAASGTSGVQARAGIHGRF